MATNKTQYLQLNEWVAEDRFSLSEINDNFRMIDEEFQSQAASLNELDNRIDNIVAQAGDSNAEIVDARHDSVNNVTYTTLKDRLDSDSNKIKNLEEKVGDLTTLNTTAKNSAVAAINELDTRIDNLVASADATNTEIADARYDSRTNTTYTTLKDRLNSHSNEIGNLTGKVGDLTNLKTANKNSMVEAVNEHDDKIGILSKKVYWVDIVQDYQADPTGVNDSSAKVNQAITDMYNRGGGFVYIPDGVFYWANPVYMKSNVKLLSSKNALIKSNYTGFELGVIQFNGTLNPTQYPLASDVNEGSLTITLTTGMGANFQAGDYIYLKQNDGSVQSQKYLGEMLLVSSVSGDTLTLQEPVAYSYQVANGAWIQKVTPIQNASIEGLTIDCMGTTNRTAAFSMDYTVNCSVKNIVSYNGSGRARISGSRNFEVDGLRVYAPTRTDPGYGYALIVANSSYGNIRGVRGEKTRHCVDFTSACHHVNVSHCFGYNAVTAAFSSHGQNCRRITFEQCHAIGGYNGFSIGNASFQSDDEVIISNCVVEGTTSDAISYGVQSSNGIIANCIIKKAGGNGINLVNASNVTIQNVIIVDGNSRAISIDGSSYVTVIGAQILGTYGEDCIAIIRGANNVKLSKITLTGTCGKDMLGVGFSSDGTRVTQVDIEGCTIVANGSYGDLKAIRIYADDVTIQNNRITGNVIAFSPTKLIVANNRIPSGTLDLRITSGLVYMGNIGNYSEANIPAHNGTTVINQNNIKTIA